MSDNTRRIFKYSLEVTDEQKISVPAGAVVLSVAEQKNNIVLYALVPTDNDPTITKIIDVRIVGTGHVLQFDPRDYKFIGTVNLHNGPLMFHVFYRDHGYHG